MDTSCQCYKDLFTPLMLQQIKLDSLTPKSIIRTFNIHKVHSLPQWIILRCPPRFVGYDPNFPTLPSLKKLSMDTHSSLFIWRKSDEEIYKIEHRSQFYKNVFLHH